MKKTDPATFVLLATLFLMGCIPALLFLWASRQAEVWRGQGVSITTFDVLMGIRPAGTPER